jgi:hypothetical protein
MDPTTDSPVFPNEFPVNPSPDYRSGSPQSSKSSRSSSRTSEKRYPDSDRETEEIFIEQPREHGYDATDGKYSKQGIVVGWTSSTTTSD